MRRNAPSNDRKKDSRAQPSPQLTQEKLILYFGFFSRVDY
jgi:hypothetical protein